jgi:uncharacterized damage-inducible protein DinB
MINRPQPDEYPAFGAKYVSQVNTTNVLKLLEELKDSTYQLFSNISEDVAGQPYAPGKWTIKQMLGHMIDTERTFAYRALVFSRNDIELPGFDQDIYVNNNDFNSRTIKDLAEEFRAVRESNLFLFRSMTEEQLMRKGIASGNPTSVRGAIYMTAGHELHHRAIMKEHGF